MKEKIIHYAKEIVTMLVFMVVLMNIISFYKSGDLNKEPLKDITVELIDTQLYSYPKSKPILIHFWATWCPTCKIEASNIQTISEYYEVLTIAVSSGSDEEIQEYLDDNELNFKVYNDKDGSFAKGFNISAYPTTLIYDEDKKLHFSEVGYSSTLGLWLRLSLFK